MSHTRRDFLEQMLAAAAAAALPACKPAKPGNLEEEGEATSDRLRVAVIGLRGFGRSHVQAWKKRKDCEIAYLCDVDTDVGKQVLKEEFGWSWNAPTFVTDMRRIFDDKSVDVVSIATPHHWHALATIWALQSGKDVYVEKPVSHTLSEGPLMVAAARKYGRICQAGTQRRCHGPLRAMVQHLREGKLGKVELAHCLTYKTRKDIGPAGKFSPPSTVDYNLWAGPAQPGPVVRGRFHYDWHWFWDYGNGAIGNNGIHRVDVARWGLGLGDIGTSVMSYGARLGKSDAGETPNTQVTVHTYPEATIVHQVRGLGSKEYKSYKDGVVFFGSNGVIAYNGTKPVLFDDKGVQQHVFTGPNENPFANFIRAVRSRRHEDLAADIQEGHVSSALCHVANISYRLGTPRRSSDILAQLEQVSTHDDVRETFHANQAHLRERGVNTGKTRLTLGPWLKLDPASSTVLDEAAQPLASRTYRAPFIVPTLASL